MVVDNPPSTKNTEFQISMQFSEYVSWTNSSVTWVASDADTGGLLNTMVLSNTAVINITQTDTEGGATNFTAWLKSVVGATSVVYIPGRAYKDRAGNVGFKDTRLQVSHQMLPMQLSTSCVS
jgi:hypothetical protein